MQKPTTKRIDELLSEVLKKLNNENLPYLVYGSYAYLYYSNNKESRVNDIDIIIEQKNFGKIQKLFSKNSLPYKLYVSEHTIHANHKNEIGNDGKPFDLSFDSYDYYFLRHGIELNNFFKKPLPDGVEVRLIKKDDLIKVYEIGFNNLKEDKYLKKLEVLKRIK